MERKLPENVWARRLKSGHVVYQFEKRLHIRVDGSIAYRGTFSRSLGSERSDVERRRLLALAEYRRERERLEDYCHGRVAPEQVTFRRFAIDTFFPSVHAGRNSPKNHRTAMSRYEAYIDPVLGDLALPEVTREDVSDVLAGLEDLAKSTRRQVMLLVKGILRWAEIDRMIERSPFFHEIHLPAVPRGLPRPLSSEQVEALLAPGVLRPWQRAFTMVALVSGLRSSEIRGLRLSDIDWERGLVRIEKGKGEKDRNVPLFTELRIVLRNWLDEQRGERVRSVYVIPMGESFAWVRRSWPTVGFHWTLHQCRHTFACAYLDSGGSIETLSEILGHGDTRTTAIYGRVSNRKVIAEAMEVVRGFLGARHGARHADSVAKGE